MTVYNQEWLTIDHLRTNLPRSPNLPCIILKLLGMFWGGKFQWSKAYIQGILYLFKKYLDVSVILGVKLTVEELLLDGFIILYFLSLGNPSGALHQYAGIQENVSGCPLIPLHYMAGDKDSCSNKNSLY